MKNKTRIIGSIAVDVAAAVFILFESFFVSQQALRFDLTQLFMVFTLFPMILSFVVPFVSTLIYIKPIAILSNYLFAVFLYFYNYYVIVENFTSEVIKQIYINSGDGASAITVSSSTDISNMISTAITILALCSIGMFISKMIDVRRKKKARSVPKTA
jgi:hypothetical protein